jgi:hypothetical protein
MDGWFRAGMIVALSACVTVGASAAAAATAFAGGAAFDVYVTTGGTDSSPCSAAAPCASLGRALGAVASGGTVHLGPGDFPGGAEVPDAMTVTVAGAGVATSLDGKLQQRVLYVGARATVRLLDLNVIDGVGGNYGGGILNVGDLTLERTNVMYNSASQGAGIYSYFLSALSIIDSRIAFNVAGPPVNGQVASGGGITFVGNELSISGSTVDSNAVQYGAGQGSGLLVQVPSGTASLTDTTIAGNVGSTSMGGFYGYAQALTMRHVTITGNTSTVAGNPENAIDGGRGSIDASLITGGCAKATLLGGSTALDDVVDSASCRSPAPGALVVPGLTMAPLASNGGPTPTRLPAFDNAARGDVPFDSGLCEGTDQRGVPWRSAGATSCDAGAVQTAPDLQSSVDAADFGTHDAGATVTMSMELTNVGSAPISLKTPSATGGYQASTKCDPADAPALRPGRSCVLSLSGDLRPGPDPGTLRVDYADGTVVHTLTVAITATGMTDAPVNLTDPGFDATPHPGVLLTADPGQWVGRPPMTFTYDWWRCEDDGGECVPLGWTGATYTPTDDQVGYTLQIRVTATNPFGRQEAVSSMWRVMPRA